MLPGRNTHANSALLVYQDTRKMASLNEKSDVPIQSELPTVPATRRLKVPEDLDKKLKAPWVPRANQVQAVFRSSRLIPRLILTMLCAEYGALLGCLCGAPRSTHHWRSCQEVCDAATRGLLGFRQGRQVSAERLLHQSACSLHQLCIVRIRPSCCFGAQDISVGHLQGFSRGASNARQMLI